MISMADVLARTSLKRAPYSEKDLTDGKFLNLHPYKGRWLISFEGVNLGSIRKIKSGWDIEPKWTQGIAREKMMKACDLLDESYAAGGK